jgi:hypothetical protein
MVILTPSGSLKLLFLFTSFFKLRSRSLDLKFFYFLFFKLAEKSKMGFLKKRPSSKSIKMSFLRGPRGPKSSFFKLGVKRVSFSWEITLFCRVKRLKASLLFTLFFTFFTDTFFYTNTVLVESSDLYAVVFLFNFFKNSRVSLLNEELSVMSFYFLKTRGSSVRTMQVSLKSLYFRSFFFKFNFFLV